MRTRSNDPKTGRFLSVPRGEKPQKMLYEEQRLGCKFEDDYRDKYLTGKLGQKRFARRWNTTKNGIFCRTMRGGRRCWIQMLELPSRTPSATLVPRTRVNSCPVCECVDVRLENAHWIPAHKGGPALWFNLLKLCPNCHTRLDDGEKEIEVEVKELLLMKVAEKIVSSKNKNAAGKQLAKYSEMILRRTMDV